MLPSSRMLFNERRSAQNLNTPALQIEGLAKLYRSGEGVKAVSFRVNSGEIVGMLGPNGSGKTTTLRCAVGLLVPDSGTIRVYGHAPGTLEAQRATAFIPDSPDLYPALTVEEHLRFRAQAFGLRKGVSERIQYALEHLQLGELSDRLGGELSRGQRQRAMLAGALIHDALVYILDEPTVGLDPPGLRWLTHWLRSRAERQIGVVVATHSLEFVTEVADRVVVLVGGRVVSEHHVPDDDATRRQWRNEVVATFPSLTPNV